MIIAVYLLIVSLMVGGALYMAKTVIKPDANKPLSVWDRIVRGFGVLLFLFVIASMTGVLEFLIRSF